MNTNTLQRIAAGILFVSVLSVGGFVGSIAFSSLTGQVPLANAEALDTDCCGGGFSWSDWQWNVNVHLDGGGGGGGGYTPPEPYCVLTLTQGPLQSTSYPPQTQYILSWTAPYATSFSINNGVGTVTPATGGTHSVYLSSTPGVYTGTAVTPYGTVTCSTVPLPPPPICTLDLTRDQITWTTQNATSVVIVPLTNSPQVPGGSCTLNNNAGSSVQISEANLMPETIPNNSGSLYGYQIRMDMLQNGGFDYSTGYNGNGLATDQQTLNRLCAVAIPGSTANYQASGKRAYNSPSNNSVMRWTGSVWQKIPATQYNSHVSGYIVCNVPAAPQCQLSGSHTFVPPLGVGTHTYKLTATGPGGTIMCEDTIVIEEPKKCELEISKTANKTTVEPNEYIEYTINFKNKGDAKCTGSGVKVVDVLDPGLTFISETHSSNVDAGYVTEPVYTSSDRTVRWNAWDLDPNESGWVKLKVKANTPTQCTVVIPNKAKITSKEYNNFTQWVETPVVNVTVDKGCTPPTECKLEISKASNKSSVEAGEQFEYTINFMNVGGKKCTGSGVLVKDTLDQYLQYVSETHSSNVDPGYLTDPVYKSSDRTVRFNAWDLDPNESGWVKIKVKALSVPQCPTNVHNVAKITSYEYNNFQTFISSNIVTVEVEDDCTPPPQECKLEITKSANKTNVGPYEEVEYTINFKNAGGKNCTGDGVKVIDVVDERLEYKSESRSSNVLAGYVTEPLYNSSTRTLTWNAGTLTPGETGWVKWKAKTKYPSQCTETVPNTAKITSKEYSNFTVWVESNVVNLTLAKDCPNHQPPVCTMSLNPTSINPGGTSTLSWTSQNVTSVIINNGIGSVQVNGSTSVSTTTTATYTGTFSGPGGTITCSATLTVTSPNPQCTLSLSKTVIKPGESTTLSWTSSNVNAGSANGNVGTLSPVSGGSMEIFPSDDFTYVANFTGPYGNVSCQASVDVQTTTSGCQPGSCPGGLNQPSTVMFQKPGDQPLAFVYLSQIPYTGFEAGPALTFIFWLTVALIAALGAYYVMGQGGLRFVMNYASGFAGIPTEEEIEDAEARARERAQVYGAPYPEVASQNVHASTLAIPARAPIPMPAATVAPKVPQPSVDGVPMLSDVIESRAHASGVLISPEAVEMAEALSPDRAEALRMFGTILNEAVRTIAREDGWVMLTSDRFEKLAGGVKKEVVEQVPVKSVLQPMKTYTIGSAQPASIPTTVDDAAAVVFAGALLAKDRDAAFSIIRSLEHDNVSPVTLMTATASVLDRLYRARKGGQNGIDASLYQKAEYVSDENLHKLVEVVTHSLDPLYSNPFTGVKLALAQAFELLG